MTHTPDTIFQEVSRIIRDFFASAHEDDKPKITLQTRFEGDVSPELGAWDSLDSVELIMALEDHFNIMIFDEAADKFKTVGDIVDYLCKIFGVNQSLDRMVAQITPTNTQPLAWEDQPAPQSSNQGTQNMSLANINLAKFHYTKADGSTTKREVVVVEEDGDRLLALEIQNGDLTPVQPYLAYTAELQEVMEHLRAKYGLDTQKLPYKSFKLAGVSGRSDINLAINL